MLEDPSDAVRDARMTSPVFDPSRLTGVYTTTPLMALSPAVTAQAHHHLVAPGTPVAGYASPVLPPADWPQHFLQIANLQGAGFLSPAGHHPQIATQGWPPASPLTLPIPNTPPPLTKQTDKADEQTTADSGGGLHGLVSGATHVGDTPTQLPVPDSFSPAAWLKAVPYCFPLPPAVQELPNPHPRSTTNSAAVDAVLHSKSLTEQLLREFTLEEAVTVLRTALSLLGRSEAADEEHTTIDLTADSTHGGSLPSVKLVHPDEFKNPSTFLKIYGDPLCFAKNGPLPKKGRNGNWECSKCGNVNFPRRFRCNMCSTTRHEEGDRVVSEYARQVYERYLYIYKSQQQVANNKQNNDSSNNNNNNGMTTLTQPQPINKGADPANGNHSSHRAFQFNARTQQPRQYTRRNHNNNNSNNNNHNSNHNHPNTSRQPSNNSGYLSSQHHRDQFAFY